MDPRDLHTSGQTYSYLHNQPAGLSSQQHHQVIITPDSSNSYDNIHENILNEIHGNTSVVPSNRGYYSFTPQYHQQPQQHQPQQTDQLINDGITDTLLAEVLDRAPSAIEPLKDTLTIFNEMTGEKGQSEDGVAANNSRRHQTSTKSSQSNAIPAPVKRMPVKQIGKTISRDKRKYVSTGSGTSSVDEEEEVRSLVAGSRSARSESRSGKNNKRKRKSKRTSRSRSSSSDSDSSGRSRVSHVSRASSVASVKNHDLKHHKAKKANCQRKRSSRSPLPHVRMPPPPLPPPPQPPAAAIPVPSTIKEKNNDVYSKIIRSKSSSLSKRDTDTVSVASSRRSVPATADRSTSRKQTLQNITYSAFDLVPELYRDQQLVKDTVQYVVEHHSGRSNRRNMILDDIGCIKFNANSPLNLPRDNLNIDMRNYLVCSTIDDFGFDKRSIKDNKEYSLLYALRPVKSDAPKENIDVVFTEALAQLVQEYDDLPNDMSDQNIATSPRFISGRYVELRLLRIMEEKYNSLFKDSFIGYLSKTCPDKNSPFTHHMDGNSKLYLSKLRDRYNISFENFEDIVTAATEGNSVVKNMRVWTDRSTQVKTNIQIVELLKGCELEGFYVNSNDKETCKEAYKNNLRLYRREVLLKTKQFLNHNVDHLGAICRASELFSWLCFGLVVNDEVAVSLLLHNYSILRTAKRENNDVDEKGAHYNYPLHSEFPVKRTRRLEAPIIETEDFLDILADGFAGARFKLQQPPPSEQQVPPRIP